MCGIVGIVAHQDVNQLLYDSLTVLQHRGQDAAGIVTYHDGRVALRKGNGLVRDVFYARHMRRLKGSVGIGHVRYPTAGSSSESEAQPIYVNSPYGITLAHNGNLTNADQLKEELFRQERRHLNTASDSEVLLNVFAHELLVLNKGKSQPNDIFKAIARLHERCKGAYAVVGIIANHGLFAFRDPNGIRPVVYGIRETDEGQEVMVASESVTLSAMGFKLVRDLKPGEALYVELDGTLHLKQCAKQHEYNTCIFEYVYLARPDSTIDGVSVYNAHIRMGDFLANKVAKSAFINEIDVIIPIPDTSRPVALQLANKLNIPYREGFIKNRYIGRTFIMPNQHQRKRSVKQKLNAIEGEFKDKNVLLVDDSIVRGTTSHQIIQMARDAGAKKVFFASASPPIRYPNVYGIDMPTSRELIAHGRTEEDVCQAIDADGLVYQSLNDLEAAVRAENPQLKRFDASVFTGEYITNDIDEAYLKSLELSRNESTKANDSESDESMNNWM